MSDQEQKQTKKSTELNDEELKKVSGGGERPVESRQSMASGAGAGTAVIAII